MSDHRSVADQVLARVQARYADRQVTGYTTTATIHPFRLVDGMTSATVVPLSPEEHAAQLAAFAHPVFADADVEARDHVEGHRADHS